MGGVQLPNPIFRTTFQLCVAKILPVQIESKNVLFQKFLLNNVVKGRLNMVNSDIIITQSENAIEFGGNKGKTRLLDCFTKHLILDFQPANLWIICIWINNIYLYAVDKIKSRVYGVIRQTDVYFLPSNYSWTVFLILYSHLLSIVAG